MNEQYEEIKEGLPDAVVTKIQDTIKVIFSEGVLFDIGSASLNNERVVKQFDTFASVLNHYRQTRILINGYTDNTGDENYNFKLSLERANNSKKLLVDNQVSELRIFTNGLGSKKPIASNNTKQGRSKNRRIEFVILYDLNKNSKK